MKARMVLRLSMLALALFATITPVASVGAPIPCNETSECKDAFDSTSAQSSTECVDGFCTNPFVGGCLSKLKKDWVKSRVCHSDDNVASKESCKAPDIGDYLEMRVMGMSWQTAIAQAWIMQILLSELVGVPASIETGVPEGNLDFYHPERPMTPGKSQLLGWQAIRRAHSLRGDCRDNLQLPEEEYIPCAHVVPETCAGQQTRRDELEDLGMATSYPIGALTQDAWYIPKFTLEAHPSLGNYAGLVGPENGRKLAEVFNRPTKWKDYCDQISLDNCTKPDQHAKRPPYPDTPEGELFFHEEAYTGYFRPTQDNNCTLNNSTFQCTGHFIDYPCGWTSYFEAQAKHLDIRLKSEGDEPVCHGYTYEQHGQLWKAANATRSHAMIMTWAPNTLHQSFIGSDFEMLQVVLPLPSKECNQNRMDANQRCNPNITTEERLGSPLGACDFDASFLYRTISDTVHKRIYDPTIDEAKISPAHDLIRSYTMTTLQLNEIMQYWTEMKDPREATCQWFIDNFEAMKRNVPTTFPRVVQVEDEWSQSTLAVVAMSLASMAFFVVLITAATTYVKRDTRPIKFAQLEFLCFIIVGLFLVSLGSLLMTLPVSDEICIVTSWLVVVGYTMELIPLLVKISALAMLLQAAKKMKRVKLERKWLFGIVFLCILSSMVFAAVWTGLDPNKKTTTHDLTDDETDEGERIVMLRFYCASNSDVWRYCVTAVHLAMLLSATVLAIQTRNVRDEVNESLTLGVMIYSHFLFIVLRLVLIAIESIADIWKMAYYQSILFSLDAMLTCAVYFIPKFFPKFFKRFQKKKNATPFYGSTAAGQSQSGVSQFGESQFGRSKYGGSQFGGSSGGDLDGSMRDTRCRLCAEMRKEAEKAKEMEEDATSKTGEPKEG